MLVEKTRKRHNSNQIGGPSKDIRSSEAADRTNPGESFEVQHLVEADFEISNQGNMRQEIEVSLVTLNRNKFVGTITPQASTELLVDC